MTGRPDRAVGDAALGAEARHEDVLEELAGAATGAAIDVPAQPLVEAQAGPVEDLGIERPPIVDDDHDRRARPQRGSHVRQHVHDPVQVRRERRAARAARSGAQLELAPVVEAQQLVRIPVLLVVVDEARVGR